MESSDEVMTKMLATRGGIKTGPEFGSKGRLVPAFLANYSIVLRTGGFFLFVDEHDTLHYLPPNIKNKYHNCYF